MVGAEGGISLPNLEVSRARLMGIYRVIEERAIRYIREGNVVDNPLLTGEKEDDRYSVTAVGFITGSVNTFIKSVVIPTVENSDTGIQWIPDGFIHITLRDLDFNEKGRKASHIDAIAARKYFEAVRKNFEKPFGPIEVELTKIIPTIDQGQNSVSVVAAFLPKDTKIVDVRQRLGKAVQDAGLVQGGREGGEIIFSTLGRFPRQLLREGSQVPLLAALDKVNQQIPTNCNAIIGDIDLLSTAPGKWISIERHVYLIPPISLVKENPPIESHFVKPAHRKMLDKV